MVIEFTLIQNFILAIIIVSLIVVLIFLVKHALAKKPVHQEESLEPAPKHEINTNITPHHQENKEDQDYRLVLGAAQKHAKNLLYHSSIAASDMIMGVKKTNEHMEGQLDKVLQDIAKSDIHTLKDTTSQFDKDYQKTLEDIQKQLQDVTASLVEKSQNTYSQKLDEFTENLLKKGLATQGEVDKKTAELLSKAESEIEEYKKSKFNHVDEDIKTLIQKVYRDVLRVSIPENVHQELILKSLESAKRDGMFKL